MLESDNNTFDNSKSTSDDEKGNKRVSINFLFGSFIFLFYFFLFNKDYCYGVRKETALNNFDFFFCHVNRTRKMTTILLCCIFLYISITVTGHTYKRKKQIYV